MTSAQTLADLFDQGHADQNLCTEAAAKLRQQDAQIAQLCRVVEGVLIESERQNTLRGWRGLLRNAIALADGFEPTVRTPL